MNKNQTLGYLSPPLLHSDLSQKPIISDPKLTCNLYGINKSRARSGVIKLDEKSEIFKAVN